MVWIPSNSTVSCPERQFTVCFAFFPAVNQGRRRLVIDNFTSQNHQTESLFVEQTECLNYFFTVAAAEDKYDQLGHDLSIFLSQKRFAASSINRCTSPTDQQQVGQ